LKLSLKVPPVAQGAVAVLLIWLLARYVPIYHFEFIYQNIVVCVLIAVGLTVASAGIFSFIKLSTTVDPRDPGKTSKLVIIGIYQYSRNPMYLGILLVIVGVAVYFGALSSIIALAGFVGFINKYQIVPEEIALQNKFGESYSHYLRNVRRWL